MFHRARLILKGIFFITFSLSLLPLTACGEEQHPDMDDIDMSAIFELTEDQLCAVATNMTLDEVILNYEGFTVSFNPTLHLPNWVAWTLSRYELENSTVPRTDNFRSDDNVAGCATLADYTRSGYDRGHMAPAADMKWSAKAMDESFLLTNICPQHNELNNGAWKNLEEKCRSNASRDSLLIIVCGPVLTRGFSKSIGTTPVPVPPSFFKVILTPGATQGPNAIGFIMENSAVEGGMQQAAVSVDEVEKLTGHNFFHLLPDNIEKVLESDVDFNLFSTGRRSKSAIKKRSKLK